MRRIVLVAVLAIILPSLVLTLVGLKLTLDLKSQLERSLAEQYASSARAKVEQIEAHVAALEERLKRDAQRLEPSQIVPTLDELRRTSPIARELVLLKVEEAGANGVAKKRIRMLYPTAPKRTPTVPETLLWNEPFPPAARQANSAKAIQALQRYRERTLSPAARVRATQSIAAVHFREERFSEAVEEYRRLLRTYNVAVLSPSLALLARYQIALAYVGLSRSADALNAFLALYAELVAERTGVADASRIAYFKARTREHIEALLAPTDTRHPLRRRYDDLLEQERARAERTRFLAYLRRYVLPRLELLAPPISPDEEGFRHRWDDELAEEPYAIAYAAVRGHDEAPLVLGIRLDLHHVRAEIIPEALRSSRFGQRVAFVVRDRKNAPVFGEAPKAPLAASEAFPAIFQSWRLGLIERQPAQLRRLALRNVHLFAVVTSCMILAIIIGVVITLRGTARELEVSQLKSDFVSNVSHELKTPLALIRMFGETLEMGRVRSPGKIQEYYSIISRESERLTQLINNVLDFSRIEGGRKTYDFRLDNLADVVRDTLRAYSYELAKKQFELETDIPDEVPDTLMDRNAISLALLNLLSNAVKYSADDCRVRVALGARNGALTLEVTDHGIGIDRDHLDAVFDKFFREPDEAVRGTRGSGLGLAIVQHSVQAHGGTITVESEKGKGSTFTITLPIRKTLSDGKDPDR